MDIRTRRKAWLTHSSTRSLIIGGSVTPVAVKVVSAWSAPFSELQFALRDAHADAITRLKVPGEDLLRQWVLDLLLDDALEGPGAIYGVEARLAEHIARGIVEY